MSTPIERLIDATPMTCTICAAPAFTCGCWTQCECGWYFRSEGGECRNATHWRSAMADPCTCGPGDGTESCPREDECLTAFYDWHHGTENA